ncbi:benzyl alcohol O-benzoyltransferase-like [Salvia miltiorrhiza]|uniref:benzyl alcohol O-benzoyltransferase-like n=1 Tax=Salvia miltiorrhiza TaxID=226208 RepID=UPI0025AB7DF5|nr:benzyl alcohol O-benzoyltransferase-like [Salvia miltiorrhiza]
MQIMVSTNTSLSFKIIKKSSMLVSPAESTPYEFKYLSDIDDQGGLRAYIPIVYLYPKNPSMEGKDPVNIIRDAIAKALVFYYPLAGRLREFDGGKLVVECTGQGVVFAEADADVMLHQFGDPPYPPFPNMEDLLHMSNHNQIIDRPLLLIQVTRLKCGGFIFACGFSHPMCDGYGFNQFMSAVAELARGASLPSILPVWERHLLSARRPPRVSFTHHEYDVVSHPHPDLDLDQMVERSFFFSPADISALRHSLPPHLRSCSNYDIVAGCAWRCRTIALSPKPDEQIRFLGVSDIRKRMKPPLPVGYYGNVIAFPAAVTTAGELSKKPLEYAVELVRKAKNQATDEYLRSVADLMVTRDRPNFTAANTYLVSDLTHLGLELLDFGWGNAAYGGVAKAINWFPNEVSWYMSYKNKMGEVGTMVPICLSPKSMQLFVKHLQIMMTAARTTSAL